MRPPIADDAALRVPAKAVLAVIGITLAGQVVAAVLESVLVADHADVVYSPVAMLLFLASYAAMAAAVIWAARRTGDVRRVLGVLRPASWKRAAGAIALVLVVGFVASAILGAIFGGADEQGIAPDHPRPGGLASIAAVVLAYGVIALAGPIVEELFFRGLVTAAVRRRLGAVWTVAFTAAVFAVAHFIPSVMPAVFALGLLLGGLYERQGTTIPGMVVHCLYNGLALTASLTSH
jgi:membrane protease YdiL (CAAX protease family)